MAATQASYQSPLCLVFRRAARKTNVINNMKAGSPDAPPGPASQRQPLLGVTFGPALEPATPPVPVPPPNVPPRSLVPPAPVDVPASKVGAVPPSGLGASTHAPVLHSCPRGQTAPTQRSTQAPATQASPAPHV